MGKLWLISGYNNSGKSRYAESLVAGLYGERYYIATMIDQNAENHARIENHRAQRAGLDFHTLEMSYWVGESPVTPDSIVLLEDVSNLLANVIFNHGGSAEDVLSDIRRLRQRCRVLFAVTISGLNSNEFKDETASYIRNLQWLNEQLLFEADCADEMRDGKAVRIKGGDHAIL